MVLKISIYNYRFSEARWKIWKKNFPEKKIVFITFKSKMDLHTMNVYPDLIFLVSNCLYTYTRQYPTLFQYMY